MLALSDSAFLTTLDGEVVKSRRRALIRTTKLCTRLRKDLTLTSPLLNPRPHLLAIPTVRSDTHTDTSSPFVNRRIDCLDLSLRSRPAPLLVNRPTPNLSVFPRCLKDLYNRLSLTPPPPRRARSPSIPVERLSFN